MNVRSPNYGVPKIPIFVCKIFYEDVMDEIQRRKTAQFLARNSRARAKRAGIPHTIRWTDIEVPDRCPILDEEFWPVLGQQTPTSATIDRKDSDRGYVPGNVWVISLEANKAKGRLSLAQLKTLVKLLEG